MRKFHFFFRIVYIKQAYNNGEREIEMRKVCNYNIRTSMSKWKKKHCLEEHNFRMKQAIKRKRRQR